MKTQLELLNEINIDQLSLIISEKLGYFVKFTGAIEVNRQKNDVLVVESNELKQHAGIMANTYQSLKIIAFNYGFTQDNHYFLGLHWSFTYENGSSNGSELLRVWWNFSDKKWVLFE